MAEIFVDPAADVELADVLLALGRLLSWLVVVALCAIIVALVYSILWPLNWLVNHATAGILSGVPGTHAVESAVTSALGAAVSSFDKQVGSFWHGIKTIVSAVAEEILGLSIAFAYLQWWAANKLVKLLWHEVGSVIHAGEKAALQTAKIAERDAIRAERYAKSVAQGIYPRLRTLEHDVTKTIPREITYARDLARAAEAEAAKAWDLVRSKPWEVGATAFAGAVAIALQSLGLGNLRCPAFTKFLGKYKCGLGSLLDAALGLLIAGLALESVCEFLPLLEDAFGAVVGPMTHLLNEVPLGACEQVPEGWATLNVAAGPLPPAQTLGTLPG